MAAGRPGSSLAPAALPPPASPVGCECSSLRPSPTSQCSGIRQSRCGPRARRLASSRVSAHGPSTGPAAAAPACLHSRPVPPRGMDATRPAMANRPRSVTPRIRGRLGTIPAGRTREAGPPAAFCPAGVSTGSPAGSGVAGTPSRSPGRPCRPPPPATATPAATPASSPPATRAAETSHRADPAASCRRGRRTPPLSTGASKPATYGRFKTSQGSGFLIPFHTALELRPGTSALSPPLREQREASRGSRGRQ